jgi:BirA family biotin operon repressor/biotin-[acetyl-CoA-carboxylase] ligase
MCKTPKISHTSFGYKIYSYNSLSSTNGTIKQIAQETSEEHIVVIAETQSQGRGRRARKWVSPRGGLWFSILLRPKIKPKEVAKLTFIISSTIAETLEKTHNLTTEVKWPNDILVKGKKICGILTETSTLDTLLKYAVIGVGLNANIDLSAFPKSLQKDVTTLKHELDCEVDIQMLLQKILQDFERKYQRLLNGNYNSLLREWKIHASFLGKPITVRSLEETFSCEALDVDQEGSLIVKMKDGEIRKVVAGDVTVRT